VKAMIKKGNTRCALLYGKYAFKIPSMHSYTGFLQGLLANKQEHYWCKETHHPRLAKVHYCDKLGLLLIMERADYNIPLNPNEYTQKEISNFFKECEQAGLPVDPKPNNIGVFDGKWKLIDYGS
jgi:hypothetical protein